MPYLTADKLKEQFHYFGDMKHYGAGGEGETIDVVFRLLAVKPELRGQGVGKLLIQACFNQVIKEGCEFLMIHFNKIHDGCLKMYERIGFQRYPFIDFGKMTSRFMDFDINYK